MIEGQKVITNSEIWGLSKNSHSLGGIDKESKVKLQSQYAMIQIIEPLVQNLAKNNKWKLHLWLLLKDSLLKLLIFNSKLWKQSRNNRIKPLKLQAIEILISKNQKYVRENPPISQWLENI